MRRSAYGRPRMRLRHRRLEALLDCVATIEHSEPAKVPAACMTAVAGLVECDSVTYNEVDPAGRSISWLVEPADAVDLPDGAAIFAAHMHEHPLIAHHARTPTAGALRISDLITLREFRRTALYQEFFGPLSITRQIVLTLPTSDGLVIGLALDRARRDFSEEDRTVLDLLRPHLTRARADAQARENATRTITALGRAMTGEGHGIITLSGGGRPTLISPLAAHQLTEWFPGAPVNDRELPDALRGWIAARLRDDERRLGAPAAPLQLARNGRRLTIRLLPRSAAGDPPLLMLDERRPTLSGSTMLALGLTRREGHVLRAASRGATNAEIAGELRISPATVKKHLEHIYAKLNVSTRGAAVSQALTDPMA
jgi:DNA-binding CsgD family transcriptional regulator/GAF domain-containing protein